MAELIGSMVCQPVLFYDWVIPDFLNWASSAPSQGFSFGPDFAIRGITFFIAWYPNATNGTVRIWLGKRSEGPIILDHFSLSLVGDDGSEREICSKENVTFNDVFTNESKEDAIFQKSSIPPKFFPNGELCIRSRIKIRSQKHHLVAPIQDNSVADDLSLQIATGNLSFTDSILVCDKEEFPVHRFMLATRSPVFKAMFSHEEASKSHNKKVSN
jgi:hypothetical protein